MRDRARFVRVLVAILGAIALAGCDREPIMAPDPVSPADLRASLPELKKTGSTIVKDDEGRPQIIRSSMNVELLSEPEKTHTQMYVSTLVDSCERKDAGPPCLLDGRTKHPLVYVDSGDAYYRPQWGAIGAATLGLGLLGGVVVAEGYCFANCGTGGKIALVTVDVVAVVVGTLATLAFLAAVERGLNN